MVKFSDIVYFNLLKKAGIVLVILGILIGIIAIPFFLKWGKGVTEVSNVPTKECSESFDCMEWCGDCINKNYKDLGVCAPIGLNCKCVNGSCEPT